LISTSVATAPARGWHYVELQVTQGSGNGVLSVRLNGVLAIQMNAQDTIRGGAPRCSPPSSVRFPASRAH